MKAKKDPLAALFICGIRLRGIPILPSQTGAGIGEAQTLLGDLDGSADAVSTSAFQAAILWLPSSRVIDEPVASVKTWTDAAEGVSSGVTEGTGANVTAATEAGVYVARAVLRGAGEPHDTTPVF
jgi:hypothetical protein